MAAPVQSSRFWTTGGAGDGSATYTRDQLAESFRAAFLNDTTTQGVFNGLAVSGTASPLTIAVGASCVYGFFHFVTTAGDLSISTPAVGTTGWHVVLRADWTAQTVRAVAVRNTDGVSAVPSVTQSAGTTWEIRIASGTITTGGVIAVTDTRQFCSGPAKLTATRVPFAGSLGQLTDSADFTFTDSSDTLTIGGELTAANTSSTQSNIKHTTAAGAATLGLDPMVTDGSSAADLALFRNTNTSGTPAIRIYKGDGSSTQTLTVNAATGAINFLPPSAQAPFTLNANAQGQRVAGLVAEPVGTLGLKRQGGSATDWSTQGTSTQTLSTTDGARFEVGVIRWSGAAAPSGFVAVTFPTAFSNPPIVFCQQGSTSTDYYSHPGSITASGFTVNWKTISGGLSATTIDFMWIAIGPQ